MEAIAISDETRTPERLDRLESWSRMRGVSVGRLVVADASGPDIFPVNFLADENRIYVRTAPGRKLEAIANNPMVAFEVDQLDGSDPWSVVVRGVAQDARGEEADAIAKRLWTWPARSTTCVIAITPITVTGVSFHRSVP